MTWQTVSTDPRVAWHWFDDHAPVKRAVCSATFGNKPVLGTEEKIRGRMKACPHCVRKLARRDSVNIPAEPEPETHMEVCGGCKLKVPQLEIIDDRCYLCRLKAHKEGHA